MTQFLTTALEATKAAQEIILHYAENGFKVSTKPDHSPVTQADRESEAAIRQIISQQFPGHGFIGEEAGSDKPDAEFHWIIDPIDGTKNFVRGIPLFATQLALMQGDQIILGISNAPKLQEQLHAVKGGGAYCNDQPIQTSSISDLNKAYLSYGTLKYFEDLNKSDQLLQLSRQVHASRGFGDFFSYHLLAQGKIDIMLEAKLKIWDIAALSLIITEAGGQITDFQNQPITTNTTTIIATNPHLHHQVSTLLNSAS